MQDNEEIEEIDWRGERVNRRLQCHEIMMPGFNNMNKFQFFQEVAVKGYWGKIFDMQRRFVEKYMIQKKLWNWRRVIASTKSSLNETTTNQTDVAWNLNFELDEVRCAAIDKLVVLGADVDAKDKSG